MIENLAVVLFLFVPLAQIVEHLPAVWKTLVQSLSLEDPLEKGMATQSSILAWRIPWTERSLAGYSPQRHKELNTTEWLTLSFHLHNQWWGEHLHTPTFPCAGRLPALCNLTFALLPSALGFWKICFPAPCWLVSVGFSHWEMLEADQKGGGGKVSAAGSREGPRVDRCFGCWAGGKVGDSTFHWSRQGPWMSPSLVQATSLVGPESTHQSFKQPWSRSSRWASASDLWSSQPPPFFHHFLPPSSLLSQPFQNLCSYLTSRLIIATLFLGLKYLE